MGDSEQHHNRLLEPGLRAQLCNEQIERIKAEVHEAFAEKLQSAKTREEKRAIKHEMKGEIQRRTEALRDEADCDTPDCL